MKINKLKLVVLLKENVDMIEHILIDKSNTPKDNEDEEIYYLLTESKSFIEKLMKTYEG